MQYVDLQPFEDFIRPRNLVDQKHLPFYMKWVLRFLRSEFDRDTLTSRDLLQCFSDQLARDNTLEDWQRRQAVQAVKLYLNVFLPEEEGNMGSGAAPRDPIGNEWDALREMKDLLKLRH